MQDVYNYDDNLKIDKTDGATFIYNAGKNVTVNSGEGNDTVMNYGENAVISVTGGNDIVKTYATKVTVIGGSGNDTIISRATPDENSIEGTAKKDSLAGNVDNEKNLGLGGNDTLTGGDGVDYIDNAVSLSAIDGGAGNDTIYNTGNSTTINGGEGNDEITANSFYASINGGSGDDLIRIGKGKDSISGYLTGLGSTEYNVTGGKGNDTIYGITDTKYDVLYQYSEGDGNDVIYNFNSSDVLKISADNYSTSRVNNDVVINVGTGSITLKDYKEDKIHIKGTSDTINTIVLGTENADSMLVESHEQNQIIEGYGGNDSILNRGGSTLTINGGSGNDTIENGIYNIAVEYAKDVVISGGTGNDKIRNNSQNGFIYKYAEGDGDDEVMGFGHQDTLQITSGSISGSTVKGNDVILYVGSGSINLKYAAGVPLRIKDASGKFSTTVIGSSDVINLTANNDNVVLKNYNVTVNALGGADTVIGVGGSNVVIYGNEGDDLLETSATNKKSTLSGDGGNDTLVNVSGQSSVSGGYGNDSIENHAANNVTLGGDAGNDTIYNYAGNNLKIDGGYNDDVIANYSQWGINGGTNVTIDGGNGNDSIYSSGDSAIINGGGGNDTLNNYFGRKVSIIGGHGDDLIISGHNSTYYHNATDDTINAGIGNDIISLGTAHDKMLIQYVDGNGVDTIYGFNASDTVKISADKYSTTKSGNDLIINVGNGSMILKNSADIKVNIDAEAGSDADIPVVKGTSGNDKINNDKANVIILGLEGNDTIKNNIGCVTINAGAGNDLIENWISSETKIIALDGDDTIKNVGSQYSTVDAGEGNDSLQIFSSYDNYVTTGAGKDTIFVVVGDNSTIDSGDDDDYIHNEDSSDTKIFAGAGNDIIHNASENVTVDTGAGNDTLTGNGKEVILSGIGYGKDVVTNYRHTNTVKLVKGTLKDTVLSGSDIILKFSEDDSLTLKNASDKLITIDNVDGTQTIINKDRQGIHIKHPYPEGNLMLGGLGADTIDMSGYSGSGSVTIDAKEGDDYVINYTKAFIYARSGDDTIQNRARYVLIDTGDGNDSVTNNAVSSGNESQNTTIIAGAGNDTIENHGNHVTINAGDGNDYIWNQNRYMAYEGETDFGNYVNIIAGSGDDTVRFSGKGATINTGAGNDSILFGMSSSNLIIDAGDGNDTIENTGSQSVTINAGKGNDVIYSNGLSNVFYYSEGDGNDTIYSIDKNDTIQVASGNIDSIYAEKDGDVIIKVGSESIRLNGKAGYSINIQDSTGKVTTKSYTYTEPSTQTSTTPTTPSSSTPSTNKPTTPSSSTPSTNKPTTPSSSTPSTNKPTTPTTSTPSNNKPTTPSSSTPSTNKPTTPSSSTPSTNKPTTPSSSTPSTNKPTTPTTSTPSNNKPTTPSSSTPTTNKPTTSPTSGSSFNGSTTRSGGTSSNGGSTSSSGGSSSSSGGSSSSSGGGTSSNGDGNTSRPALEPKEGIYDFTGDNRRITDFKPENKIKLSCEYKGFEISGNNFVIQSASGGLTLENARDKVIDVADGNGNTAAYVYLISGEGDVNGSSLDKFEVIVASEGSTNHLIAGSGGSSLVGGGGVNILEGGAGQDNFIYKANNDTITNYQSGEILKFEATYTGWVTDGNDLVINSAEGSVRIQEATDKLVELAGTDGNVIAHVYKAGAYEGAIDGRGFGAFEVIIGADNANNQIFADAAGSSLWGGRGNSNDDLYGNTGNDEYIYSYGNGQDNIFQAGSEDTVNLLNISLEQITATQINDNGVNLQFTDGGSLNISGQAGSFKLGGQSLHVDYQNKIWS